MRREAPTRIAFFASCVANQFFAEACSDAVRLLRHFGFEVHVPSAQTCCGQPAYSAGHRAEAVRVARHAVDVFRGYESVVLPSGSCASMVRNGFGELLDEREAADLAERTYELSEFLARFALREATEDSDPADGVPALGVGLKGKRIAYHHGCHALRELGVAEQPISLLRACGAEVVEWEADEECCGFGGFFSVRFPEVSAAMTDRKLDSLPPVDVLTSADPGCLIATWRTDDAARTGGAGSASRQPAPGGCGATVGWLFASRDAFILILTDCRETLIVATPLPRPSHQGDSSSMKAIVTSFGRFVRVVIRDGAATRLETSKDVTERKQDYRVGLWTVPLVIVGLLCWEGLKWAGGAVFVMVLGMNPGG